MTEHHDFLNPTCSFTKLDIFLSRRGILEALTSQIGHFHGTLLDVGCGRMPYKPIILAPPTRVTKYIGLDIRDGRYAQLFGSPDLEWDGHTIPLEAASVDCAMSTEVYVQCSEPEIVMRETARVLKPGGMLFLPFLFFGLSTIRHTIIIGLRLLRWIATFEMPDLKTSSCKHLEVGMRA